MGAKIGDAVRHQIGEAVKGGENHMKLAQRFGVSQATVYNIAREFGVKGVSRARLPDEVRAAVRRDYMAGVKGEIGGASKLARRHGVSLGTVTRIARKTGVKPCRGFHAPEGDEVPKPLTKQAMDRVLELAKAGDMTQADIAKAVGFGLTQARVSTIMLANGIRRTTGAKRNGWTADDDEAIVDGFRSGMRMHEIGEAIGRSDGAVAARIKALRAKGVDLPRRQAQAPKPKGIPQANMVNGEVRHKAEGPVVTAADLPKAETADAPDLLSFDGAESMKAMLFILPVAEAFVRSVHGNKLDEAQEAFNHLIQHASDAGRKAKGA